MWLGSNHMGTLGGGATPRPAFGAGSSGASLPPHILQFLQSMQQNGALGAPAAPAPGFEQQLMAQGSYTTPPARPQFNTNQPGISPALAGILGNIPSRPTGLPPGILTAGAAGAPGVLGGVVDKPIDWAAKAAAAAKAPVRVNREDRFGGGGGGQAGENSRDRADRNAGRGAPGRGGFGRDSGNFGH